MVEFFRIPHNGLRKSYDSVGEKDIKVINLRAVWEVQTESPLVLFLLFSVGLLGRYVETLDASLLSLRIMNVPLFFLR